jgi:hypothetical protein
MAENGERDRRAFSRYAVWFPVTVVSEDEQVGAICRDASAGGLLVSSTRLLSVGSKVAVRFRVSVRSAVDWNVDAEVVRSEMNQGDMTLAFPFRLGIRFLSPLAELPIQLRDELGPEESR